MEGEIQIKRNASRKKNSELLKVSEELEGRERFLPPVVATAKVDDDEEEGEEKGSEEERGVKELTQRRAIVLYGGCTL